MQAHRIFDEQLIQYLSKLIITAALHNNWPPHTMQEEMRTLRERTIDGTLQERGYISRLEKIVQFEQSEIFV